MGEEFDPFKETSSENGRPFECSSDDDAIFGPPPNRSRFYDNILYKIKHNDPCADILELLPEDTRDFPPEASYRVWRRIGYFLSKNDHVRFLILEYLLTGDSLKALCVGLQYNRSIESISLSNNRLRAGGMASLSPFLINNVSLRDIDLCGCCLGSNGIRSLSSSLLRRNGKLLQSIQLSSNEIVDDNSIHIFTKALTSKKNNLTSLKFLSLGSNYIGKNGCSALASLLKNPECRIELLDLCHNSIDDEGVFILAASLLRNTTLESLELDGNIGITNAGCASFLQLVCNTASIDDTFFSNHTLANLGEILYNNDGVSFQRNDRLNRSLWMNGRLRDKKFVARDKIIWCILNAESYMANILDIDVRVMPHALSWIAGDDHDANNNTVGLSAIHRIIKNIPALLQPNLSAE